MHDKELQILRQLSAYSLPDNPSQYGWTSKQIKAKLYEGLEYLFNLFYEITDALGDDYQESKTKLLSLEEQLLGLLNGTKPIGSAIADGEGNIISSSYAKVIDLLSGKVAVNKYVSSGGQLKTVLSLEQKLDTFLREYNDFLSEYFLNGIVKQAKYSETSLADKDGNPIHSTYIKKTEIADNLTETSTVKPLSANQGRILKQLINTINSVLKSDDVSLDTIKEIVDYIKTNKELIDYVTTSKVSYNDIVDDLESKIVNKPLSANQGALLKESLNDLEQLFEKLNIIGEAKRIEIDNSTNGLSATNVQTAIDEIVDRVENVGDTEQIKALQDQIVDLKNALYGSILSVQEQEYENVGVAVMDRANGYPIVDNQKSKLESIKGKTEVKPVMATVDLGTIYWYRYTSLENEYVYQADLPDIAFNSKMICSILKQVPAVYGTAEDYSISSHPSLHRIYAKLDNSYTTDKSFKQALSGVELTYETTENEIVSTDITKIVVGGFNKFDGELEVGSYWTSQGTKQANVNRTCCKNKIEVIGGQTYTLTTKNVSWSLIYIFQYDKNGNLVKPTKTASSGSSLEDKYITAWLTTDPVRKFTFEDNTTEIGFFYEKTGGVILENPQICFHLTGNGALNGVYKPYIPNIEVNLATGTLNGIGTAQDEITETELKKVIGVVDLGTLNWGYNSSVAGQERFASSSLLNIINTSSNVNIVCARYESVTAGNLISHAKDKIISNISGYISIYDSSYTDATTFKQSLQGIMLYYETITPIILTKDYTAKVDLGTLNWGYAGGGIFYAPLLTVKNTDDYTKANIICSKYATVERSDLTNRTICISGTDVIIQDTSYTNATTFKQAMSGVNLTYETTEKVSTPLSEIGFGEHLFNVERGGTIATDSNGDLTLDHVVYKPIQ
jgi:hypothetical protein